MNCTLKADGVRFVLLLVVFVVENSPVIFGVLWEFWRRFYIITG